MWIGWISIVFIIFFLILSLVHQANDLKLIIFTVCWVTFLILSMCSFDTPNAITEGSPLYHPRYYCVVDNQQIFFDEYQRSDNDVVIPKSSTIEYSWINTRKFCDSPIAIVVPDGQVVSIHEINPAPAPQPYIVGGCLDK